MIARSKKEKAIICGLMLAIACSNAVVYAAKAVSRPVHRDLIFTCDEERLIKKHLCKILKKTCTIESKIDALQFTVCDKIENSQASLGFSICDKIEDACESLKFTISDKIEDAQASLGVTICEKISKAVETLGFTICDKVENSQASLGFTICEKIEQAIRCFATPIENDPLGETITISECGHYCLAEDLGQNGGDPVVKITASNVILDLNGHKIISECNGDGIEIGACLCNVVIKDGFIITSKESVCVNLGGIGIRVKSPVATRPAPPTPPAKAINVQICNVDIKDFERGISACDVDKLLIKDCVICWCEDYCAVAINSCTVDVFNSIFNNCFQGSGLTMLCCNGVRIDDCIFNKNAESGLIIDECECVEVLRCHATGKDEFGSNGSGFFIGDINFNNFKCSENIILRECFACYYKDGFKFQDARCTTVYDCVAKENAQKGFSVCANPANKSCEPCVMLQRCHACLNGTIGFYDDGNSIDDNQYYCNTACKNCVSNYSSSIINAKRAPVTSPINAYARDNIDCDNTDRDRIEVLCSKIDSLFQ